MDALKKNWMAVAAVVIVALAIYLYTKSKSVTAFQQYSTGPSPQEVTAALQAEASIATAQIGAHSTDVAALLHAIEQRDAATASVANTQIQADAATAIEQSHDEAALAAERAREAGQQSHDIFGFLGSIFTAAISPVSSIGHLVLH